MAKLLRRWDNWEDGQGFLWDGMANGVAHAQGMIGKFADLSPIAASHTHALGHSSFLIRYGFINKDSSNDPHLYLLCDDGTDTRILKYKLTSSSYMTAESSVLYSSKLPGHPIRFEGNWLWTMKSAITDIMYELTATGTGGISGDTIASGDASSGGGHLITYGHQLSKISPTAGISILKTDGNPTVDADWGTHFPVGDDKDTSQGGASVQGRAYVQRGRGLYTFNDRGRAGSVFEDFGAFQQEDVSWWTMQAWKGGLVFTRQDAIYYWQPGQLPINISIAARGLPDDYDTLYAYNAVRYYGIISIGDYIYVKYRYLLAAGGSATTGGIMVGFAKRGDPTDISWWNFKQSTSTQIGANPIIVTDGDSISNGNATTILIDQTVTSDSLNIYPLAYNGAPTPSSLERLASGAESRIWFPAIDPHRISISSVRVHLDNLAPTISAAPTTREHFELIGFFTSPLASVAVLGEMYTNGTHEFNIRNMLQNRERYTIGIQHIAEVDALTVAVPHIRSVEIYGE